MNWLAPPHGIRSSPEDSTSPSDISGFSAIFGGPKKDLQHTPRLLALHALF